MTPLLVRYRCPKCGGGLSRTLLYPSAATYELQFPPYRVPLARICAAIAVVGFGLAFIHVAFSLAGVLAIAAWVWWNYYSALQCDDCREYYISGQFAGGKARTIEWGAADTRALLRRAALAVVVGLAVFLPIYLVGERLAVGCSAECAKVGRGVETNLVGMRCTCVPK